MTSEERVRLLEEMNALLDKALACSSWEEARVYVREVIRLGEGEQSSDYDG
jgi:hypothetical protein